MGVIVYNDRFLNNNDDSTLHRCYQAPLYPKRFCIFGPKGAIQIRYYYYYYFYYLIGWPSLGLGNYWFKHKKTRQKSNRRAHRVRSFVRMQSAACHVDGYARWDDYWLCAAGAAAHLHRSAASNDATKNKNQRNEIMGLFRIGPPAWRDHRPTTADMQLVGVSHYLVATFILRSWCANAASVGQR